MTIHEDPGFTPLVALRKTPMLLSSAGTTHCQAHLPSAAATGATAVSGGPTAASAR